jgi:hypothetical protein
MSQATQRWVSAVNHHGEFGKWALVVCREPRELGEAMSVVRSSANIGIEKDVQA